MPGQLDHPYANFNAARCLRGQLHTHSTRSDGTRQVQAVLDEYAGMGYDFLMMSDHDVFTTNDDYAQHDGRGMVLIPGNEVTRNGPHMLHVGATQHVPPLEDRQAAIDACVRDGAFVVVNHPNWQDHYNHCPIEKMRQWTNYVGMEIFNGVIHRLSGTAYATDKWDMLLSEDRRIWGFANDDSHTDGDSGLGWNMVDAERDAGAIVDAMREGRFYASTGVVIDRIEVDGRTVTIETKNADKIVAVIRGGRRPVNGKGTSSLTYTPPDDAKYVRFECYGPGEQIAWTQPFFLV